MRLGQQYLDKFGELAKVNNTMILPANLTDAASMIATAMTVIERHKKS